MANCVESLRRQVKSSDGWMPSRDAWKMRALIPFIPKRGYNRPIMQSLLALWSPCEHRGYGQIRAPAITPSSLESLLATIGIEPSLGDYFQTLRDLRNKDIYTGGTHVSTEQVDEAIEEAAKLAVQLRAWLEAQSEG